MFGNVTAPETGKYRGKSMQHTCSRWPGILTGREVREKKATPYTTRLFFLKSLVKQNLGNEN